MANNKRSSFFQQQDSGRKRQPYTRKEILWQVGICVAILLIFQAKDTFFPSKPSTSPTPAPSSVGAQVSNSALDTAAVEALKGKITIPVIDHKWNVYVVNANGASSYTLTTTDITPAKATMDQLTKAGYDIGGSSVRINVKDIEALTALFKLIPTSDTVNFIGANGYTVDNTLYAQLGNAANKGGLKATLGTWDGPIITPTPVVSPTPSATPKKK